MVILHDLRDCAGLIRLREKLRTQIVNHLCRGVRGVQLRRAANASSVGVTTIRRAELTESETKLTRANDQAYGNRVLTFDLASTRRWGQLSAALGHSGADLQIAATALEHGLTVVTGDVSDFAPTGVSVIDPFSSRPAADRAVVLPPNAPRQWGSPPSAGRTHRKRDQADPGQRSGHPPRLRAAGGRIHRCEKR